MQAGWKDPLWIVGSTMPMGPFSPYTALAFLMDDVIDDVDALLKFTHGARMGISNGAAKVRSSVC